jgi:hypothetical protein
MLACFQTLKRVHSRPQTLPYKLGVVCMRPALTGCVRAPSA